MLGIPASRTGFGAVAATLALLGCCTPRVGQFYTDSYYAEDRVYRNEALGFALVFPPGWRIHTAPADMSKAQRTVAKLLREQGAELVFAGETLDGGQGTRGIAENLNRTNEAFLVALRAANVLGIEKDLGATTFMAGDVLSLKWEYVYRGMRFVEFLFRSGTYNIRIAFWAPPDRYDDFLPVYESAMATLSLDAIP
jgi:hypothetical protein